MVHVLPFFSANDVEGVRRVMQAEPELLEAKGPEDMTALQYAVVLHKVASVQTLLALGADPNSTLNWEVLHWAILDRNLDIVQLLLEAGANPDTSDAAQDDATPLTRAAAQNDTTCMELLLKAGCDVNKEGVLGTTALTILIDRYTHCCDESVTLLLRYGADPTIGNTKFMRCKSSCIEIAARKTSSSNEDMFKELFQVAESKWECNGKKVSQMRWAISGAISTGLADRVLWLLHRFDPPQMELLPACSRLLADTCTHGDNVIIAKALLQKSGSSYQAVTGAVITAAIDGDRKTCMRAFLNAGVNMDVAIQHRFSISTPLMFAIEKSRDMIAVGLIQSGCDILSGVRERHNVFPVSDRFGEAPTAAMLAVSRSPVAYAATRQMESLVKTLYSAGCNMHDVIRDMESGVISYSKEMEALLSQLSKTPLSLKEASRLCIRLHFHVPLLIYVECLPLPQQMKDYILFRDCPQCLV